MQRADAPVRRPHRATREDRRPQEPPLADDAPVDLAGGVRRDVGRAVGDDELAQRLLQHLTQAFTALDAREGEVAVPHLRWVKGVLPRYAPVREALGVALYLAEDYAGAVSELNTHRRLTGSVEHNHLVADALRATGEGQHRIPELVEAMEDEAEEVDPAALTEGRIVWASWLADRGDLGAARAALAPVLDPDPPTTEEHHLRAWYVAGDLAERAGDRADARRWFQAVSAAADGFFDTEQRLAAL